jgi:rSAM/selenodomain-associated transferase 2
MVLNELSHEFRVAKIVSVIMPTLNEGACLQSTLQRVMAMPGILEVIVVDGGSCDETIVIARECGARVVFSSPGRGQQMQVGARLARGTVLWFLHADTCPCPEACAMMLRTLSDQKIIGGNFEVVFDGPSAAARFLTWLYPQLRRIGLCYGDSAFFVCRTAYDRAGEIKPIPIFEDLDLLRRLRRQGRFVRLAAKVTTSSRRFEGRSFCLTFARWTLLQVLYWIGVSPTKLGFLYAHIRQAGGQKQAIESHGEKAAKGSMPASAKRA